MPQEVGKQYSALLQKYIQHEDETDLYAAQQVSRKFIEKKISPEEVISLHKTSVEEIFPELAVKIGPSYDFLIEVMIHYGLALMEHQSLIRKQEAMQIEMDVAVKVQDMLLETSIPKVEGLDIGLVSKPAKKMSGDYVYFIEQKDGEACVAVADVMGKGLPAALCMSMIKFGMDSLRSSATEPQHVLQVINQIVEKSMDDSMFISMFYGKFDKKTCEFTYGSAGHEPALLYRADEDRFIELDAKGLLLGIRKDVDFQQKSVEMSSGDFIVMLTDGVTEGRNAEGFIEEEVILDMLRTMKDRPAQQIVDHLYTELFKMQNYMLHDDFTLVLFKKE
ncbi:PP2C family protein-serine/threonine phosphatase [Sporosarcina aquimarina]|uniref:PP2C family protein-serine/threonine phosphatase n=1 Tax=Sporosarcina aquimarina TaxID=114975 RepID=A0ABU4G1H3_9BACL|nr:PP2C family protein-serine/threonine phosphatase [Sporosarcina aquimarina]MDW0110168.1 PP2C family protein-serine/threonine phosphatase [Sporosarcina aquimarina]